MKKFYYLFLAILPSLVFAETKELKTQESTLSTTFLDIPVNATETYQYYLDNKGEYIKNGSYEYVVKENFNDGYNALTISYNNTATFKDDLLNGPYKSNFDMEAMTQGKRMQMKFKCSGIFKDGIFDGPFNLTTDETLNGSTEYINITFKEGQIVGNVDCLNNKFSIKGKMNNDKLNGDWEFSTENYKYDRNFINGILIYEYQRNKSDDELLNKDELSPEMQDAATQYANNTISLKELNSLGYDIARCELDFSKIKSYIFEEGNEELIFTDKELNGINHDGIEWTKVYNKLVPLASDSIFNSLLLNMELIKGEADNDPYKIEYKGKTLDNWKEKLWRWDDCKIYEFDDNYGKYYISCNNNEKYYITQDQRHTIDSLVTVCREEYKTEQHKIQLENTKNLVVEQLNKLKDGDLSLAEAIPSIKNFCPIVDFEIISCVEDPDNNYLFNDNKFVYTCTINTKNDKFQDSYYTYKTDICIENNKFIIDNSFVWNKTEKIDNDWDEIISLDQDIKNNNKSIQISANAICPDVLTEYQQFEQNYNLIPSADTKESIERLNKFINIQNNCSKFIEGRNQFTQNDSIIISYKKECKPIFKIYSEFTPTINIAWTAQDEAVTRIEEFVSIQKKLISFILSSTKDDLKLIKKEKIKDVYSLIDLFDL